MQELIPILDHNGQKAVSARELHAFLESKREFATWIKDRIKKYGLIENQDYVVFDENVKNLSGGRPLTEYALTIDAAKELSMVEGNAKGKQARQYFIECEKIAKEKAKPLSQIEMIIQSAQILLDHDKRISSVEQYINEKETERKENTELLLSVSVSTEKVPEISLRNKIRQCVNSYSEKTHIGHRDIWQKIYSQLYYLYNISIKAYKKTKKETLIDVAERNGFLDKIYIIISNMIREVNPAGQY